MPNAEGVSDARHFQVGRVTRVRAVLGGQGDCPPYLRRDQMRVVVEAVVSTVSGPIYNRGRATALCDP
jgi:hypothetical protein